MNIKDLKVMPTTRRSVMPVVIDKHYMGRVPPISAAFGLFYGEKMIGAITYGVSSSTTLRRGVCGDDEALVAVVPSSYTTICHHKKVLVF